MPVTRTVASAVFLFLIFCLFTCSGSIECVVPDKRSLSREEFKNALSTRGLKFVHQNICGLEQKFDELQEFVETHTLAYLKHICRMIVTFNCYHLKVILFWGDVVKMVLEEEFVYILKTTLFLKIAQTYQNSLLKVFR